MIAPRLCTILLLLTVVLCCPVYADSRAPDGDLTFACNFLGHCPRKAVPGAVDRDVRPFEGRLDRPCAWRTRPTPAGPRKVRVCS